jgi:hypothetical protein
MISNIIRNAFDLYANKKNCNGVICANYKKIQEHVKEHAHDRRFKLFILASDTHGSSVIVEYAGSKYYLSYDNNHKRFNIERS